jgi:hypothetical protein
MEREPCEEFLGSGSTTALKFLATLNEGLILALRGADLRLMQLERAELDRGSVGVEIGSSRRSNGSCDTESKIV